MAGGDPNDRCLTCWEHGSPFDGPCPHCGYNGTVEKIEATETASASAQDELVEALNRLAKLTPASANAHTAQDLCLTVRAIAESALAKHRGER